MGKSLEWQLERNYEYDLPWVYEPVYEPVAGLQFIRTVYLLE